MLKSGIYQITCWISGKIYIGSAVELRQRWREHKSLLNRAIHKNIHLQSAWTLHREKEFTFHILEYCEKENLIEREQYWLDSTKCYNRLIGYNLNKVANSQLGYKWSDESRKRQSIIQTGKKMSPEAIAKTVAGNTGKKRNAEQRARMSKAQTGKIFSEASKLKMSLSRKGKVKSEESKQKLRDTHARKKLEAELRA